MKKKEKGWEDFMPFYSQWYWTRDWLNQKCKAWYNGPRIDWMHLVEKNEKKDITSRRM